MSPLTLTSDTEPLHEWAEDCALIPPIVHFASLSVRRMCSRSASVRVAGLALGERRRKALLLRQFLESDSGTAADHDDDLPKAAGVREESERL